MFAFSPAEEKLHFSSDVQPADKERERRSAAHLVRRVSQNEEIDVDIVCTNLGTVASADGDGANQSHRAVHPRGTCHGN